MNIVFAGTPEFSVAPLRALDQSDHNVIAVYTQPDRGAGRGQKIQQSPVKQYALARAIPVFQPASLKHPDVQNQLSDLRPDLIVVVAYGLLLPEPILQIPRFGCINIHASILPRWRGAAPIQRAILAGDTSSGISIMQMDVGLDTGDVLLSQAYELAPQETGGTLHDKLSPLGAQVLMDVLQNFEHYRTNAQAQPNHGATYAKKITKKEALLDWAADGQYLERKIRAFDPWPVAHTCWNDKVLRIWQARWEAQHSGAKPGTVIGSTQAGIEVATGAGVIIIEKLQLAGKKITSSKAFVNAYDVSDVVLG